MFKKIIVSGILFISVFFISSDAFAAQTVFLDTSFDPGTGLNIDVYNGQVQPDGKLVIPGDFTTFNGVTANRIVRINTNGTADTAFIINTGTGFNNSTYNAMIQPDGKIVVAGPFSQFNGTARNSIARLNADGTLDTSFNAANVLPSPLNVYHTSIQSDGKIILVGNFSTTIATVPYSRMIRFNTDGTVDTSFNPSITGGSNVAFSRVQSDDKIVIVGNFTTIGGVSRNRIARLNADGTLDTSFNPGTGINPHPGRAFIQSDGKIIVIGSFTNINGVTTNRVARLNSDGTLDTGFITNTGTGFNAGVSQLYVQPKGKIIVTGDFTAFNGVARAGIARLNSDGTLDTAFEPGTGPAGGSANADTLSQSVLGNTKFYIGGTFTTVDGTTRNRIALMQYIDSTAPVLSNISMSSNYPGTGLYATTGNIITLSFSTDDVLTGSTVTIGGQAVTPVCNDTGLATISCTATFTVTSNMPAVDGPIGFSISATSVGGSTGPVTTTSNGAWVGVDRSSMTTSNSSTRTCDNTTTTFCSGISTTPIVVADNKITETKTLTLGKTGTCPAELIITQNMRSGARNGKYHTYTKAVVKEVKILQKHMNRLGFASGLEDGILGPITDGAIKRMQKFLGTYQDGMVGPITRSLINNSCGE